MSDLQIDLFGAAPASSSEPPTPTRPPAMELYPPAPTLQWARRLTAAGAIETWIQVHILWTGVVVETLSLGTEGQWFLYADGKVQDIKPDPGARRRTVFRTAQEVWDMHPQHPLIPVAIGTHCITYRFAQPGEDAPAVLPMPDGGNS